MYSRLLFETEKYVYVYHSGSDFSCGMYMGMTKDAYERAKGSFKVTYFTSYVDLEKSFDDSELKALEEECIKDIETRYKDDKLYDNKSDCTYRGIKIEDTIDCMRDFVYKIVPKLKEMYNGTEKYSILVEKKTRKGVILKNYDYAGPSTVDLVKYIDSINRSIIDMTGVLEESVKFRSVIRLSDYSNRLYNGESGFLVVSIYAKDEVDLVSIRNVLLESESQEIFKKLTDGKECEYVWELGKQHYYY